MSRSNVTAILEEISISGYRSCESTVFRPNLHLSALIGINGAGKTNILNAIHLLSIQSSRRFYGRQIPEEQYGGLTTIVAWFVVDGARIGLRLTLVLSSSSRNNNDILDQKEEWNFASITKSTKWIEIPEYMIVDNKNVTHFQYHFSTRTLNRAPLGNLKLVTNNPRIENAITKVFQFRIGIKYYSASQFTDPTRCPSNFEIDGDRRLDTNIRSSPGHLQFLYDLYSLKIDNKELYDQFVDFISKEKLGLVSRLTWSEIKLSSHTADVKSHGEVKKVKRHKTLVIPKIQIGRTYITFNQLSEGTFKTLAMIFYIMTDASSCLLLEEPEVCVHHGLLRRIIDTITAHSDSKQVIFSTHSDLVLENIAQDQVFVVYMKRAVTHVSSLAAWVGKQGMKALNSYLEETGTLGEYWRTGGLS